LPMTQKSDRLFIIFILFHLIGWTVIPALVRFNLPLDAIEGTIWGHQLEWGYDKNPYLNGWLTALATYLDGQSGWMIYLFSQLSVIIAFSVVYKLGKTMLSPIHGLISVLIMEGIQYYNIHAIDFNDNNLELSLWALCIYFFYQAITQSSYRSWIFTGLFAGLGLMAKYYTLVLMVSMTLLLLRNISYRKSLLTLPPYIGLLAFLLVILPHFYWLTNHDYITITYVFERADAPKTLASHFIFPAQFAIQQAQVFIPAILLAGLLFIGKKPFLDKRLALSSNDKQFLYYIGLGPFLLTLALSFIFGITLRAGWGMPLFTLWSIILISWMRPNITWAKCTRLMTCIFILMGICFYAYRISIIDSPDQSSANFPGDQLAKIVTDKWRNTYHTPLFYVAGSRWLSGNIGFYSKDQPAVFIEWDTKRAPWIHLDDLQKKGGVFIWEISANETLPDEIRKKFPTLTHIETIELDWYRNTYHLPPTKIGIVFLPPTE
jgi:4-amino-4-deoxy-L-arabinose transferase-like glycosyltransferase